MRLCLKIWNRSNPNTPGKIILAIRMLKDLEPIQSEYPRKDHISDTDANKRIEETLYKLLYHKDPKVLEG
ncbi:hypothetical protein QE152_g5919 [Popillia japonica]|uniref:Uncharacterized protein n=1 Tax=Popillia japonica TaxID=7064 RepID=A0AAW1MIS5_POPJA